MLFPIKKAHPISNHHKKVRQISGPTISFTLAFFLAFYLTFYSDILSYSIWHLSGYLYEIWSSRLRSGSAHCDSLLGGGRKEEVTLIKWLLPEICQPLRHGFRHGTPQLRTLLSAALGNRARVGAGDLKPGNWLGLVWISWWFHDDFMGFHWDLMGFKWDLMVISNMMIYWEY